MRKNGFALVELLITVAVVGVLVTVVVAASGVLRANSRDAALVSEAQQLVQAVDTAVRTTGTVGIEQLVTVQAVPQAWVRGAAGARTLVHSQRGTFQVGIGTLAVFPNPKVAEVRVNGLTATACTQIVSTMIDRMDEAVVAGSAGDVVVFRRGTATPVEFNAGGLAAACAAQTAATLNVRLRWGTV